MEIDQDSDIDLHRDYEAEMCDDPSIFPMSGQVKGVSSGSRLGPTTRRNFFGGRRRMRGYGRRVRRATDARSPVVARTDRRFCPGLGPVLVNGDAMSANSLLCMDGKEAFT